MKTFLGILIALALLLVTEGAWELMVPPYSDVQLSSWLVDTWEPHALVTAFLLVLLFVAALFTGAIWIFGGVGLRRLSSAALLSIAVAAGVLLASHIALTNQVTRVTGQTFGPLYGLLGIAG